MRLLPWAAVVALAAGCRIAVDLAEYDRMQGELGVRSVLRGKGFTLWSPQDWVSSKEWFLLLEQEIPAAQRALGLAADACPHVQVLLREVEGMQVFDVTAQGGGVSFARSDAPHPLHGVAGWAGEGQVVIPIAPARVIVLEDGREVSGVMAAGHYRSVVRHELAHVFLGGRGLPEEDWFSEGAADLLEGLELVEGVLVDAGAPREALDRLEGLNLLDRPLLDLLEWREDPVAVVEGRQPVNEAARSLCGLYVRWSLGLSGDGSAAGGLLEGLTRLAGRSRAEHLAGEARWHAWLADQVTRSQADAGIPTAADYTLAPSNRRPAPPEPTTGATR